VRRMIAYTVYPVGTVLVHNATHSAYRVIDPPEWLAAGSVRTMRIATGVESTKSVAALDKFYTAVEPERVDDPHVDPDWGDWRPRPATQIEWDRWEQFESHDKPWFGPANRTEDFRG